MPPPRPKEGNNQKAEKTDSSRPTRGEDKHQACTRCLWRSDDQSLGSHVVLLLWLLFTAVESLQLSGNCSALSVQKTGFGWFLLFDLWGFPPVPWGPTGVAGYLSIHPETTEWNYYENNWSCSSAWPDASEEKSAWTHFAHTSKLQRLLIHFRAEFKTLTDLVCPALFQLLWSPGKTMQ